uniref:Ig-like domain-containing protein n=1 Tax=Amphiprion ocellaris TaxID=80972 RepID=A0AAQ5YQ81_AMPOC
MLEIMLVCVSTGVNSIDLIQPDSMLVQPGQTLTITCLLSGYSVTDSSYGTGWIRQHEGKPMEWIFHQWGGSGGSFYQNNALKNKFSYSRDMSAGTVTITGQNLHSEDTAVYYCVRRPTVTQTTNRPAQKLNNQQPHTLLICRQLLPDRDATYQYKTAIKASSFPFTSIICLFGN